MTYEQATQILRDCRHTDRLRAEWGSGVNKPEGLACSECWNRHVSARRQARREQLAQRPNDCMRCGLRPHTWTLAGYYHNIIAWREGLTITPERKD